MEEWFYLAIPLLLYLSTRLPAIDRRKVMLILIVLVILSVTAFRFYRAYRYGYSAVDEWENNLRRQVVTRLDSLMFGVLGAYLSIYRQDLWSGMANRSFVAGAMLLIAGKAYWISTHDMFYLNYINLMETAFGTLLLLPKLSAMKRDGGWFVGIVTFVSLISYSMYLLNLTPVLLSLLPAFMHRITGLHWMIDQNAYPIRFIAYWLFTLTGSYLLYRYFEKPMTDLRERFYARRHAISVAYTDSEAHGEKRLQ